MVYKIELQSGFSEYGVDLVYEFDLIQSFDDGRERSLTTITNQDPAEARHFAFQPGQSNPKLEWVIYDNGEDKSNGSLSSSNITDSRFSNDTVTTVEEQLIWITEYIFDNTSDPRWSFYGGRFSDRNGDGTDEGTNVTVKKINTNRVANRSQAVKATIDLKLGVTI